MNLLQKTPCTLQTQPFGTIDGQNATLWTLTNSNGMQVSIMNFGATITSIRVPDKNNQLIECVLGFNRAEDYATAPYRNNNPHLGAIIGRHAGRINLARAPLNQKTIQLTANLGEHHLHGGSKGFDQHWWEAVATHHNHQTASLTLHLYSKNGDEGYPGNLHIWVTYTLTNENELKVDLQATCDQDTFINLTQHSYFNLSQIDPTIKHHHLYLSAKQMIATDATMMPTGKVINVPETLNFQNSRAINNTEIDTAYILPPHSANTPVAQLTAPDTNLTLTVKTDAPVLVVYNAQHLLQQTITQRKSLQPFAAICFEPQRYTDAPNHPSFPNNILYKGEKFNQHISYSFNS